MSFTDLCVFDSSEGEGTVEKYERYGNSHGFLPAVYRPLSEDMGLSGSWLMDDWVAEEVASVADDPQEPMYKRIVVACVSCERIAVSPEKTDVVADAFEEFEEEFSEEGKVSHFGDMASDIRKLSPEEGCCWYPTSLLRIIHGGSGKTLKTVGRMMFPTTSMSKMITSFCSMFWVNKLNTGV